MAISFQLFIVFYEEPHLEREFGSDYVTCKSEVGRWLPRLPPRSGACITGGASIAAALVATAAEP